MSLITLHKDVLADLDQIAKTAPQVRGQILALFRQLNQDPVARSTLLDHGLGRDGRGRLSVSKWVSVWRTGEDFWRLKDLDLERLGLRYRIIYLYVVPEDSFKIMAVVKREDLDYDDPTDPTRQRVLAAAGRLFPRGGAS